MKKNTVFTLVFWIAAGGIFTAGIIHTILAYINMYQSTSSAPAEVALFLLIPYALGLCLLFSVRAVLKTVQRRKETGRMEVKSADCMKGSKQ